MPRRRRMGLTERRLEASKLFTRGYTIREVADTLDVHENTASSYKRWWHERNAEEARGNPELLRDVIGNTLSMLKEVDDVRSSLWGDYHNAESPTARASIMGQILKAQEQRAKLLGLMGIKQEWFINVQNIVHVKDRLIDFMARQLCPSDRAALERLLTGELADYMEAPNLGHPQAIPVEATASE